MSAEIIGLHHWFETPPGRYLLEWERARANQAVADVFGYHALQVGLPALDALQANRMPHQWLALPSPQLKAPGQRKPGTTLYTDYSALPFPENSLDLVVLPHALEFSTDPHATLREVSRVLVPEGRVVIFCLNPASLWGLRQRRARLYQRFGFGRLYLPDGGDFIGYWRLRDWLRLLGFEVESSQFGCYRPAMASDKWLDRYQWMDRAGDRWWPILGAAYSLVAVKRVRGMKLLGASWKNSQPLPAAPVPLANKTRRERAQEGIELEPH